MERTGLVSCTRRHPRLGRGSSHAVIGAPPVAWMDPVLRRDDGGVCGSHARDRIWVGIAEGAVRLLREPQSADLAGYASLICKSYDLI